PLVPWARANPVMLARDMENPREVESARTLEARAGGLKPAHCVRLPLGSSPARLPPFSFGRLGGVGTDGVAAPDAAAALSFAASAEASVGGGDVGVGIVACSFWYWRQRETFFRCWS